MPGELAVAGSFPATGKIPEPSSAPPWALHRKTIAMQSLGGLLAVLWCGAVGAAPAVLGSVLQPITAAADAFPHIYLRYIFGKSGQIIRLGLGPRAARVPRLSTQQ